MGVYSQWSVRGSMSMLKGIIIDRDDLYSSHQITMLTGYDVT